MNEMASKDNIYGRFAGIVPIEMRFLGVEDAAVTAILGLQISCDTHRKPRITAAGTIFNNMLFCQGSFVRLCLCASPRLGNLKKPMSHFGVSRQNSAEEWLSGASLARSGESDR